MVELIRSRRDLTPEQRNTIIERFEDGKTPKEVAREFNADLLVIQNFKSEWRRARTDDAGVVGDDDEEETSLLEPLSSNSTKKPLASSSPLGNSLAEFSSMTNQYYQQQMIQSQIEAFEEDRAYRASKRELELEKLALELEERRAELYGDDDDDAEPEPEEQGRVIGGRRYDFKADPWGSFAQFIMDVKDKKKPTTQQTTLAIDASKPLTDEQIRGELSKANALQMAAMKNASDEQLEQGLKQLYPNITTENVKKVMVHIRNHAQ